MLYIMHGCALITGRFGYISVMFDIRNESVVLKSTEQEKSHFTNRGTLNQSFRKENKCLYYRIRLEGLD
jgi:hypothetical protein